MNSPSFIFKTAPYRHQLAAMDKSANAINWALLMDMGTGKSKVIVDTASHLYSTDQIDAVVVLAPNGVHRNWVLNEIPIHTPDHIDYTAAYYVAAPKAAERDNWSKVFKHPGLRWFCFNIESASNKKGQAELRLCVTTGRTLFVIDESHLIKTPGTKRTMFLCALGKHAKFRRILTGSPITQGPLDLYSQFKFLDSSILGFSSYTAFKAQHAVIEIRVLKNPKGKQKPTFEDIVGYKNIQEMERRVAAYSFRVTKKECLDLPPKVYEKIYVEFTPEQRRVYNELLKKSVAILCDQVGGTLPKELTGSSMEDILMFYASRKMTADNAMTKMLRLQQVISGFVTEDGGTRVVSELKSNRLQMLFDVIAGTNEKMIIWARFRRELAQIEEGLAQLYGKDSVVPYHGGVPNSDRPGHVQRFQNDKKCRFFVAQQHSGGTGLTLTAATLVVYYSNDFSAAARWQSEDRPHRIGQKNTVTYLDFVVQGTIDEKILKDLEEKRALADNFDYSGGAR